MTKQQKYLEEHHHITETAIGLAIVYLNDGETDKAHDILRKACVKIDAASVERGQPSQFITQISL